MKYPVIRVTKLFLIYMYISKVPHFRNALGMEKLTNTTQITQRTPIKPVRIQYIG